MRFLRLSIIFVLVSLGILAGCTIPIPVTSVPVEVGGNEVMAPASAQVAEVPSTAIIAPTATPLPVAAAEPAIVDEASQPEEPVQTETTNVEGIPCVVPDVIGLDQAVAESLLMGIGLRPVRAVVIDETMAAGSVISQDPAAGTMVDPCEGYVMVTISAAMPNPPTNTPVPPTVTPTETPLPPTATPTADATMFFDSFETGMNSAWEVTRGRWTAVDGILRVTDWENREAHIFVGEPQWQNYVVELDAGDFSSGYGGSQSGIIVVIRAQDTSANYMWFIVEARHTKCGLRQDGRDVEISNSGGVGGSQHIRVEAQDNLYQMYVGDVRVCSFYDDTFSSGKAGVRAWTYRQGIWIDNFSVRRRLP